MTPVPLCQRVAATKVLIGRVLEITGTAPDYAGALALGYAGKKLAEGRCIMLRQTGAGLSLEITAQKQGSIPAPTEVPPS